MFFRNVQNKVLKEILDWFVTIIFAIVVSLFIISNIITLTQIKEQSMEPTFKEDDRVAIYKLGYLLGEPKRNDIVILNKVNYDKGILINMVNQTKEIAENIQYRFTGIIEKNNLIKRVVAVQGDIINIKNGYIYINDSIQEGSFTKGMTNPGAFGSYPIEVPVGKVFVLGDNRENSLDSRDLGFIDIKQIKGKAIFRVLPISRFSVVN